MNKGTTRYPKYFCDKCGVEIKYTYRKGFIGLYTYAKREKILYLKSHLIYAKIARMNYKIG